MRVRRKNFDIGSSLNKRESRETKHWFTDCVAPPFSWIEEDGARPLWQGSQGAAFDLRRNSP